MLIVVHFENERVVFGVVQRRILRVESPSQLTLQQFCEQYLPQGGVNSEMRFLVPYCSLTERGAQFTAVMSRTLTELAKRGPELHLHNVHSTFSGNDVV